jgi:hypothetical protein
MEIVVVIGIIGIVGLFIIPNKKGHTMEKNLMQADFVLSYEDRIEIVENLRKLGGGEVCCSACASDVDISFLRRKPEQILEHAMCLPCFLKNNTTTSQEDIDRMVEIGQSQGWYID